jgi:hypothetical protein
MVTKKKTTKAAASVATESRAAGAGAVAPVLVDKATTEAALRRVIQLALAMLPDTRDAAKDRPKGESAATVSPEAAPSGTAAALPNEARQSLERALDDLDPEVALKLRTLMIAGRDGKSISDVNVNMTLGDSKAAFSAAALDTSHNGALLADYLRRGHALAWATALDIERPLASWAETMPHTLDERAWLSFGKQLAKSDPGDWQCLAFLDGRTQGISSLYLRLAEHAWWSFQAVLDRPSAAAVEKQQRALTSRRSKGVAARSLASVASQLSSAQGRALRRAARAIRARLGEATAAS